MSHITPLRNFFSQKYDNDIDPYWDVRLKISFIVSSKLMHYGNMSNLTKDVFSAWVTLAMVLLDMALE